MFLNIFIALNKFSKKNISILYISFLMSFKTGRCCEHSVYLTCIDLPIQEVLLFWAQDVLFNIIFVHDQMKSIKIYCWILG